MISDEQAKKNLAANIRRLRGDFTLQEVADHCTTPDWNCYPATIEHVEKGRHLISAALLARIAYGLSLMHNRHILMDELLMEPPKKERVRRTLAQAG